MLWFPQMYGDFACDIQIPKPNRNLQQSHQRRLDWNKFAAHKIEGDRLPDPAKGPQERQNVQREESGYGPSLIIIIPLPSSVALKAL